MIGLGLARRLILSGESIGPEEALRLGLIDHLVPAKRFEEGVDKVLAAYLDAPRTASAASKRLMGRALDAPFEMVYRESLPLLAECLSSSDVESASEAWRGRRAQRHG